MPEPRVVKAVPLLLCLIVGFVLLSGRQSRAIAEAVFGNATYRTSCPYIAETVTLTNGSAVEWRGRFHVSMYYEGHYVYGDFDHDGLRDAAVVIGESQGGSDDEISLMFLINDGKQLVHRQSAYLDDSAIVRSLRVRGDKVIVDMLIHQKGDSHGGPTKHVKMAYAYDPPGHLYWLDGTPL